MPLEILHKENSAPTRKDPRRSRHGKGRAPTTSRQWTDKSCSTLGTRSIFGNTTSREILGNRQFPSLFYSFSYNLPVFSFTFATIFLCLFSPRGRYFFYKRIFFKEEYSGTFSTWMFITSGYTIQATKSTTWTDHHNGELIYKSTKWTDHPKGEITAHKVDGSPKR